MLRHLALFACFYFDVKQDKSFLCFLEKSFLIKSLKEEKSLWRLGSRTWNWGNWLRVADELERSWDKKFYNQRRLNWQLKCCWTETWDLKIIALKSLDELFSLNLKLLSKSFFQAKEIFKVTFKSFLFFWAATCILFFFSLPLT